MEKAWPMIMQTLPHILVLCKWCEEYVANPIQKGTTIEVDPISLSENQRIAEIIGDVVNNSQR